jgi:hypothetical protein
MLAETFRADPGRVGRLRELLNDPTLATALIVVKDEARLTDVHSGADPVESVRRLSWLGGYNQAVDLLLSLAEPLPVETPEPEPTWGIRKEEFSGV